MPKGAQLFAASFSALFLELMVIRWAPSALRMVAYYANLMLLSSFLGLGVGALLASSKRRLFGLFPALLLAEVLLVVVCRRAFLPGSDLEARFFALERSRWLNYAALIAFFFSNAAVFVPLGQRIGSLFEEMPPLRAYVWDLGGSLCGSVAFGLFSFRGFSPVAGIGAAAAIFLLLASSKERRLGWVLTAATLAVMAGSGDAASSWSPYYYVTVHDTRPRPAAVDLRAALAAPDPRLRTMLDPPRYSVHVNQDFYQPDETIDPARYTDPGLRRAFTRGTQGYFLPYSIGAGRERVLVLGAGGGTDVEAALLSGARHVDAVEIDPLLVEISRKLNASGVYDDPRVTVRVDDARAFLRRAEPGYDLVVFGWLDSQALFSHMSNIRLDGYVYTVESIRAAYGLLGKDGVLSLSFMAGRDWLADKLVRMVRDAVGRMPLIFQDGGQVILCVPRAPGAPPPDGFGRFRRIKGTPPLDRVEPPTDDWPYLYLSGRAVPGDYSAVIGILAALSLGLVLRLRGEAFGPEDSHFFFLGFGFLLLETTRITDCSLFFGTTWLVTLLVVAGVLLMALAANLAAFRIRRFSLGLYPPLFAALTVLYLVPSGLVLSWPFSGRLLWTALAVPLPVFFAGLIFSLTFRGAARPAALFGANLIGAMAGGFCEYLGMATGHRGLSLLVIAAYLASLLCRLRMNAAGASA